MILGIDASNLRRGGGITHLCELLRVAEPSIHGFNEIIVWGGRAILERIEDRPWLKKRHANILDRSFPFRIFWQVFLLSKVSSKEDCDVVFIPGGSFVGTFHPYVTMSRNLLPFERRETARYGFSLMALKLFLLRHVQSHTFRKADGLIFLTRYAHDTVTQTIKSTADITVVIPHGVDHRFMNPPRKQLPLSEYSPDRPFRILYVSIIDMYKHQWNVVDAVAQLRGKGLPVELTLVGPACAQALKRLRTSLENADPSGSFIHYPGEAPYADLHTYYKTADLCLFASSCENMPNILLEGMASGLPIACSDRGPMPEILGDAGVYFDPEFPDDIARVLLTMINCPELRENAARKSYKRAQDFSWQRCATETLVFLQRIAWLSERNYQGKTYV
jgi:glycosyltransferase involved in cell wall biosynthesis